MKALQEDIKNGTFQKVYLLYGEEPYLKLQYRQRLLRGMMPEEDSMNFHRFAGKDTKVREVIDLAETVPFFAERRVLLLEDTGFFKNKCDELADYLKELPDTACLIFVESEVDKRSRMYKAVKAEGRVSEFAVQKEDTLSRWVVGLLGKGGRRIRPRDLELLLSMTGTDMGNISMEVEKLIAYTEGQTAVTEEDIRAVCIEQTENRVFEMIRAVSEGRQKRAMELYYDLLTLKEPPMRILFLLARQYRQMLQARSMEQEGLAQPEIAEKMGVRTFALRNLLSCAGAYTVGELEELLKEFADMEEAVKTGRMGDVMSVELLIIRCSSRRSEN